MTHSSFKEKLIFYNISDYENLEIIGDAILDFLVNGNIIKFIQLEQYNIK